MTDNPKLTPVTPLQAELSAITQRLRRGVIVKTIDRDTAGHIGSATEAGVHAHIEDGLRAERRVLAERGVDPALKLAVVAEWQSALAPHLDPAGRAKAHQLIALIRQKLEAAGLSGLEL
jgi:AmiR/NasT family two-component response regulator